MSDLSSYPSDPAIPFFLGFPGNLNHKPIHWKIDTGSAYGVIVSQKIAKEWNLRSVGPISVYGTYNNIRKGAYTANQVVEIAGQEYHMALVIETNNMDEEDALIGTPLLKQFRITLDYSRHKILWEPNPVPVQDLPEQVINLKDGGKIITDKGRSIYYPPHNASPIPLD